MVEIFTWSLNFTMKGNIFNKVYREKSFITLSSTFYHDERSKFNYEHYLVIYMEGHKWLSDINYDVDGKCIYDITKIQYFKTCIFVQKLPLKLPWQLLDESQLKIHSMFLLKLSFRKLISYSQELILRIKRII